MRTVLRGGDVALLLDLSVVFSRYAILFPHRTVTSKRLNEIGDIVHAQRMAMPGGRSYEVNVVKIRRTPGAASTDDAGAATAPPTASAKRSEEVDSAVVNALEVLRDKRLYDEYLEQVCTMPVSGECHEFIVLHSLCSLDLSRPSRMNRTASCPPADNVVL